MKGKTQWDIRLGRGFVHCTSLRLAQKALIDYREDGYKGASEFLKHDGVVMRNGVRVGHFSYNGRFWRKA